VEKFSVFFPLKKPKNFQLYYFQALGVHSNPRGNRTKKKLMETRQASVHSFRSVFVSQEKLQSIVDEDCSEPYYLSERDIFYFKIHKFISSLKVSRWQWEGFLELIEDPQWPKIAKSYATCKRKGKEIGEKLHSPTPQKKKFHVQVNNKLECVTIRYVIVVITFQ